MSGYTYVQSERNLWTVGRYSGPHGERWEPESDHSNEQAAQRRLHDLTYGTDPLLERVERLERAVTLLARHVGATGWNKPLQDVLDAIQADIKEPW